MIKRMRPLLGTFVEIGAEGSVTAAERAVSAAFDLVQTLHKLLSFHETTSDLTRLNQAGGAEIKVHTHTARVLKLARSMTQASGGIFNCTLGGAMVQNSVLPDHDSVAAAVNVLRCGTAMDMQIGGGKAKLNKAVKITLDGIAKGYVVDCAIAVLKRHGVKAGWVNAGGDLRVYGDLALPIQRREASGEYQMLGGLQNAAFATSTVTTDDNESFPGRIIGSATTPHIGTWSVVAHYAWRADALTKVAALADVDKRQDIVHRLGGTIISSEVTYPQTH